MGDVASTLAHISKLRLSATEKESFSSFIPISRNFLLIPCVLLSSQPEAYYGETELAMNLLLYVMELLMKDFYFYFPALCVLLALAKETHKNKA